MRIVLEFIRATIAVTAVPVVIAFHLAPWRPWGIALLVYLVVAVLALLVLNQVLKVDSEVVDAKGGSATAAKTESGS